MRWLTNEELQKEIREMEYKLSELKQKGGEITEVFLSTLRLQCSHGE